MAERIVIACREGAYAGVVEERTNRWLGVRYAAAPRGPARFLPPAEPPVFSGIADASGPGPTAWQPATTDEAFGWVRDRCSDDALRLNIWVPRQAREPVPVLVWIHGGGYLYGTALQPEFDGAALAAEQQIAVVSVNYRLAASGWLSLGAFVSGVHNLGLRDLIQALHWVRCNIAEFGGDPDAVTIDGQSAGGGCVTALLASPAARGLFHRAIAQSAPIEAARSAGEATEIAERHLELLKIAAADLAELPSARLDDAIATHEAEFTRTRPGRLLAEPVVDGEILLRTPQEALSSGEATPVPLLVGWNRDETTLFRGNPVLAANAERLQSWLGRENFAHAEASAQPTEFSTPLEQIGTAAWFADPARRAAGGHRRIAPTKIYEFGAVSAGMRAAGLGACHAIEAGYLFGWTASRLCEWIFPGGLTAADRRQIAEVQRGWGGFVRTGNPGWPDLEEGTVHPLGR